VAFRREEQGGDLIERMALDERLETDFALGTVRSALVVFGAQPSFRAVASYAMRFERRTWTLSRCSRRRRGSFEVGRLRRWSVRPPCAHLKTFHP
jgi:hypothetical protein